MSGGNGLNKETLSDRLESMGYSMDWIESGILAIPEFEEQFENWRCAIASRRCWEARRAAGKNHHTLYYNSYEDYRHTFAAFDDRGASLSERPENYVVPFTYQWLHKNAPLSDALLQTLISLCGDCPHFNGKSDLVWSLADAKWLNDKQYEMCHSILLESGFHRRARSSLTRRQLRIRPFDDALIERVLRYFSGNEQAAILRYRGHELSDEQLIVFERQGRSEQARRTAVRLLGERRYRESHYAW